MGNHCDLHTHSTYSDGTFSPAELIAEAAKIGLSAVALTDHNTVAGLPEFVAAARESSVEAIPGVEISTDYDGLELHLVGLYLPSEHWDLIESKLDHFNRKKEESNRILIRNLCQAGYVLDYEKIRLSHPQGTVNRAVIAAALLEKGYVDSVNDAFQGLLSKTSGYYVPPERLDVFDAIRFLRSVGAVPVLAHSFLNLKTEAQLRLFLQQAIPHGLAAMETMYSSYSPETTALARQIAREFGLPESGGSDFHGRTKPHIQLGVGKGNLNIPSAFVEKLKNCILAKTAHSGMIRNGQSHYHISRHRPSAVRRRFQPVPAAEAGTRRLQRSASAPSAVPPV